MGFAAQDSPLPERGRPRRSAPETAATREAAPTAVLAVQDIRNERVVHAADPRDMQRTVVLAALNDLQATRLTPAQRGDAAARMAGSAGSARSARSERLARRAARKAMQGAAKQYGKVYYVPRKKRREWIAIWFGLSFLFGSLQFLTYVWFCRWAGLLP